MRTDLYKTSTIRWKKGNKNIHKNAQIRLIEEYAKSWPCSGMRKYSVNGVKSAV